MSDSEQVSVSPKKPAGAACRCLGRLVSRAGGYVSSCLTIFGKELRSYLMTPFGWVILACVMGLQGFSLNAALKIVKDAPQRDGLMFIMMSLPVFWFYFLFIFPLITMRTFAEEERMGTLETLLTAPVTTGQVVLGKFASALVFYMVLWVPLMLYPWMSGLANALTEFQYGYLPSATLEYRVADWVGTYLILFLLGAWFISLGILCSSLTRSQIIAGIVTIGVLISYFFLGLVPMLWGEFPAASIFHYMSCKEQLDAFTNGLVDTRPVVLYLTLTVLTLALTVRIVDYRRWRR